MMNDNLLMARKMLEAVFPMAWDCGRTCGAACCQPDEDGQGGVYLFPGEEALCGGDWADIVDARMGEREVRMLVCEGECEREKRPLGCMIFPLTPVVDAAGQVDVRFDCRARAMCPLLRDGLGGLNREFVETVRRALLLIASDREGLAFLREWQALEEQFDFRL